MKLFLQVAIWKAGVSDPKPRTTLPANVYHAIYHLLPVDELVHIGCRWKRGRCLRGKAVLRGWLHSFQVFLQTKFYYRTIKYDVSWCTERQWSSLLPSSSHVKPSTGQTSKLQDEDIDPIQYHYHDEVAICCRSFLLALGKPRGFHEWLCPIIPGQPMVAEKCTPYGSFWWFEKGL
jgi:hypothetical protein